MDRAHFAIQFYELRAYGFGEHQHLRFSLDFALPNIDGFDFRKDLHAGGQSFVDEQLGDPPGLLGVGSRHEDHDWFRHLIVHSFWFSPCPSSICLESSYGRIKKAGGGPLLNIFKGRDLFRLEFLTAFGGRSGERRRVVAKERGIELFGAIQISFVDQHRGARRHG